MIGRVYRTMSTTGSITADEADIKTAETYKLIVESYPDSSNAKIAQKWLTSYEKRKSQKEKPPRTLEEKKASFRAYQDAKRQGGRK
jgi:hypothetical protein